MALILNSQSPVEEATFRRQLLRKTGKELVKMAKENHLPTSGNKAKIADRLVRHHCVATPSSLPNGRRHRRAQSVSIPASEVPNLFSRKSVPVKRPRKVSNGGRPRSESNPYSPSSYDLKSSKLSKGSMSRSESVILSVDKLLAILTDEKFATLKSAIREHNLSNNQLHEITDFSLKILGIDDANDRQFVLNELRSSRPSSRSTSASTRKVQQYQTEIARLNRQIRLKTEENKELKDKHNKLRNGQKTVKKSLGSKAKGSLKTTWKTDDHKKMKKRKSKKANGTISSMKHADSVPIKPAKPKKQASLRYDQNLNIKIKGMSGLNVFFKEYEAKKQKENDKKQNKTQMVEDVVIDEADEDELGTDDDFDDDVQNQNKSVS